MWRYLNFIEPLKSITGVNLCICNILIMLGELDKNQIEDFLKSELIGRIGCYSDGKVYVCSCHLCI